MVIRFHLDEHLSSAIAAGLRRRSIDVTTSAAEVHAALLPEHHSAAGSRSPRYRSTALRGLPPSFPFVLEAVFLALLLDWPPT